MTVKPPSTEVEKEIIKQMCLDAAKTIELQCGREYGFGKYIELNNSTAPRATQIYKLSSEERKQMDVTSNIPAECKLSIFDKRSAVAK